MAKDKLSSFSTQRQNANKHTPRGLGMLSKSIGQDGWIGGMTVAADGETFDGSARLETLADAMPDAEPIVVDSDGTRPVIVRRIDIPNADDPRAKRLGIAANRIQQVDYEPDAEVLAALAGDIDLSQFFRDDELARIMGEKPDVDYDEMWQGMPEFEQEDLGAFKSLKVNFKSEEDIRAFAELVGQPISLKTRSIWYPKAERIDMTSEAYQDES